METTRAQESSPPWTIPGDFPSHWTAPPTFPTHQYRVQYYHGCHSQTPAHSLRVQPLQPPLTPIPSSDTQRQVTRTIRPEARSPDTNSTPGLSLVSWNIDAFSPRPVARAKLILSHILEAPEHPDVVFLQEVVPGVRDSLLSDCRVRDAFYVTDAEDQTSFENVPFTTMTLLSTGRFASGVDSQREGAGMRVGAKLMPRSVSRIGLPSKYGRDALSVDTVPPTAPGRLDKVAMLGIKPMRMEVLRPGSVEVPRPSQESSGIPWSDHCGVRCRFTV